jgi:hypothetical protein
MKESLLLYRLKKYLDFAAIAAILNVERRRRYP